MRIYCQYSGLKTICPTKGDTCTEVNMYCALSEFAQVYYGSTLFQPNLPDYGLYAYPEPIEERMRPDCDVYYIRGHEPSFRRVPEGRPRIWVCSPWNKYCFQTATVIGTLTREWEKALRDGRKIPTLNPEGFKTNNVVTIGQYVSDDFKPLQKKRETRKIRKEIGGDFIIGIFGRAVASNYPHAFLAVHKWLVEKFPQVRIVVGVTKGQFPGGLKNVVYRNFPHAHMPYVTSACDLIMIPGKGHTWPVRGCLRVMEAGACGTPVILCRSPAREEHLGESYPLFQPPMCPDKATPYDVQQLRRLLKRIIKDTNLQKRLHRKLPVLTAPFTVSGATERLKTTFETIASWRSK